MKKNFIYSFLMVVFALAIVSCNSNKLKSACEEANKQFPMTIEQGVTAESVDYVGGNVVYTYSVDEQLFPFLKENEGILKAQMKQVLSSNPDKNLREMINLCKDEKADFVYKYVGDTSGDIFTITISSAEL